MACNTRPMGHPVASARKYGNQRRSCRCPIMKRLRRMEAHFHPAGLRVRDAVPATAGRTTVALTAASPGGPKQTVCSVSSEPSRWTPGAMPRLMCCGPFRAIRGGVRRGVSTFLLAGELEQLVADDPDDAETDGHRQGRVVLLSISGSSTVDSGQSTGPADVSRPSCRTCRSCGSNPAGRERIMAQPRRGQDLRACQQIDGKARRLRRPGAGIPDGSVTTPRKRRAP